MNRTEWGSPKEDVALSLSTDQSVFKLGETVRLTFSLKNIGVVPVTLQVRSPWVDYELIVRTEGGSQLDESLYAQHKREVAEQGRRMYSQLMPGEETTNTLELEKVSDFPSPGLYMVSAKRQVFKKGTLDQLIEVTSNELRLKCTG
jgi:hypothetical protein